MDIRRNIYGFPAVAQFTAALNTLKANGTYDVPRAGWRDKLAMKDGPIA